MVILMVRACCRDVNRSETGKVPARPILFGMNLAFWVKARAVLVCLDLPQKLICTGPHANGQTPIFAFTALRVSVEVATQCCRGVTVRERTHQSNSRSTKPYPSSSPKGGQ